MHARTTRSGSVSAALGLALPFIGLVIYGVILFVFKQYTTPWYLPILATLGLYLVFLSVLQSRSLWRFLALGFSGFMTVFLWYGLVFMTKLPIYDGPLRVGEVMPSFNVFRADGSLFTQSNLVGDKNTVLIFFRGRW